MILDLTKGHNDIVGASVSIKELSDETTPHAYQSRVILSARPNNISVTEKKPDALDAMQEVLEEVVRQVREKREQLRNC